MMFMKFKKKDKHDSCISFNTPGKASVRIEHIISGLIYNLSYVKGRPVWFHLYWWMISGVDIHLYYTCES